MRMSAAGEHMAEKQRMTETGRGACKSEEEAGRAIEQYADMVRRICMIHLKNYEDAEDIFQTVFLKYVLRSEPFDSPEHEKAWIIRCHSQCMQRPSEKLFPKPDSISGSADRKAPGHAGRPFGYTGSSAETACQVPGCGVSALL